ncbi:hypothetical protein CCH79_00006115, partial [Gambusia affinis]
MFVPGRLWDCMRLPDEDVYGEIMQQADVSALRLFEALVVTLPETLLQTYVLICTDIGVRSPGEPNAKTASPACAVEGAITPCSFLPAASVCFAVCLLSLAWALVLYARSCSLIRPGHLHMTPAAILCRLLWRVGMLGSRFAVLMLFTRIFKQWVLGVIGKPRPHAEVQLLWYKTVHVFLFLNVKYGPSRYRMAAFYLVMFFENALLLLASSWFFAMVSWDTVGIPAAVFCSFLIGVIALVLYYRFLHPKSFEIFQSIRHRGIGGACMERGSTLSLEEKVEPNFHHRTTLSGGGTLMDLPIQWEGWKHHHWLLIRLALKTGDVSRIWSAYGEGGLAGLMGLPEEIHSPDVHHVPRVPPPQPRVLQISHPVPQPAPPAPPPLVVSEVVQPPKPAHSNIVARPVRKAPPTTIKDMRFPEIIPFQEVIPEETTEDELSAAPSDDKVHKLHHLFASMGDDWCEWSTRSGSTRSGSCRCGGSRCSSWSGTRCCAGSSGNDNNRRRAGAFSSTCSLQSRGGRDKAGFSDPIGSSVGGNRRQLRAPAQVAAAGRRRGVCAEIQSSVGFCWGSLLLLWGGQQERRAALRGPARRLDVQRRHGGGRLRERRGVAVDVAEASAKLRRGQRRHRRLTVVGYPEGVHGAKSRNHGGGPAGNVGTGPEPQEAVPCRLSARCLDHHHHEDGLRSGGRSGLWSNCWLLEAQRQRLLVPEAQRQRLLVPEAQRQQLLVQRKSGSVGRGSLAKMAKPAWRSHSASCFSLSNPGTGVGELSGAQRWT